MDSDKVSAQGGRLEVNALETVVGSLPRSLGWRVSNLPILRRILEASRWFACIEVGAHRQNYKIYVDAPSKDR